MKAGVDWRRVVSRATTVHERLSSGFLPSSPDTQPERTARRTARWLEVAASGDEALFATRLSLDDIDPRRLPDVVCDGSLPADAALPGWTATLIAIVEAAATTTVDDAGSRLARDAGPAPEVAFQEVFAPFLGHAWARLEARAAAPLARLSPRARQALGRALLTRLSELGNQVLFLEFAAERAVSRPAWAARVTAGEANDSRSLYRDFVSSLLKNLGPLFEEYSLLGRLLATATDLWVDASAEFLAHLDADWVSIGDTFGTTPLGRVESLAPGLSDHHRGGRTVAAVTFTSGLTVVYKPKNLSAEVCFNGTLAWLNAHGAPIDFKTLVVLDRGSHGWAEFAVHLPCETPDAARRYYVRIGALLCLVHALRGTDCHYENLVACGEHPVLVDPEMLLQPTDVRLADLTATEDLGVIAYRQLSETVIGTLFLPFWQFGARGARIDVGGVGHEPDEAHIPRQPGIVDANTDRMRMVRVPYVPTEAARPPLLDGRVLSPRDYADDVVDGFTAMYRYLLARREDLVGERGPLRAFESATIRYIVRGTSVYVGLLRQLRTPDALRDAVDASIEGEVLGQRFLPSALWRRFWPMLGEELDALVRLDVPIFELPAGGVELPLPSRRPLGACFAASGVERAVASLRALDEASLAQQVYFIRGALLANAMTSAHVVTPSDTARVAAPPWRHGDILTGDDLVAEACRIAEGLRARAIRRADGGATWIAFTYHPAAQRFRIEPIGFDLFDGTCGVALFLAALTRVTGDVAFRSFALEALAPVRDEIRSGSIDRITDNVEWGGPLSCGPLIYALVRASQLLDEPALLDDASRLALSISHARIDADRHLDVLFGAAGVILGLLALDAAASDPRVRDLATACGDHLIARSRCDGGRRTWTMPQGLTLTGFSHGAAGMAYALLRLHDALPDTRFLAAAVEGMAFERSVFLPALGNWPDYRKPQDGAGVCGLSWCHGAPGIGLARLGGLGIHADADTMAEIEAALTTTAGTDLQAIDGLCCGNLGHAEFMLAAGLRLDRPALRDNAARRVAQVVGRARATAGYDFLGPQVPQVPGGHPGFFQGESGVGYTLLRLARPDLCPSVLLFE